MVLETSLDGVGDRALINNDFCEACQSGGRLLLCERCPRAFHVQCIERLVDFESVKPAESWCCPVCLYGESILRGKGVEQMPEEEMRARMAESLRDSKRSRAASIRQRDVFLLQHWGELVPFASRPALTRMRKAREGRKPLEVGTIVQVDTGRTFYDAIVLSQTSPAVYLVADLVTKTQELREEKWLLAYLPGQRGGDVPDFLSFARRPIVSETTTLKEYQQVGVNWLIQSFFNRCGGILADDMGLGKTLQTLAFLSYLQASGFSRGPALVVVPLSCAGNWAREAKRFVPHLSIAKVCGSVKERQHSLDDNEIWYGMKDIIITTYETLVSTEDFFQRHLWSVLVLDEAHRIKNRNSKVREVMDTVPCAARFLLTGTPLQNNLGELFALLKFLWPDIMAKESEMFENAIQLPELQDKAQDESSKAKVDHVLVQKIRHILGLVMLRRRKEEVIQLPPKMFHNIWLPSTPMQVNWYKKILYLQHLPMSRDLRALKKLLVRLRGVACHPRCLVTNKVDRDFLISAGVTTQEELSQLFQEDMSEEVIAQSAKLTFLDRLLKQLHAQNMGINDAWRKAFEDRQAKLSGEKKRKSASAWLQSTSGTLFLDEMQPHRTKEHDSESAPEPHKVLIFCQYISTLDLLESYCAYRNWRTLRMDGATSRVLRELDMRDFNSHDEDLFVYLIGTRAGGLGVNLASANHVVIFEQDWNPHVDHQAIDRAHRIGQTRQVHVHRPVQEWGIEERLVLRATSKLQMEQCIINTKEDEEEEEFLADSEDTLSQEEIANLLKHGASAFQAYQGESLEDFSLQELLERERRPAPISDEGLRSPELEHQVFQRRAAAQRAEREMPPPESSRSSSGRIIKFTKTFAEEFQAPVAAVNRKPKVVLKHFLKCFVCTDGCEEPRKRSRSKHVQELEVQEPQGNPVEIFCSSCPQTYHRKCLPPHARELKKNWVCTWHYCSLCNRSAADVGGMLIHCLECPSALCYDCFPPNFRRVYPTERFWSEMRLRGWNTSPQKMIFFKCNSCRTLEEQQTRLRMRAEDLAVQQDEKKRLALEEKRNLETTKKRQMEEEAVRRMKSFLLDSERQQILQEQQKWSSRVERAAEALWPKLFRSKWIFRVNLSQQSVEEIGRAMVGKKAALPSVERLKLTIETCSNCHFPGHKAKQCPMPAERTSEKQKKEDDGKDGKEAKGARASKRVCPICEASSHPRICCPKLSAEQRAEYLARIEDFRKLQEAFQEATPVQEPPKVKEIKEATAAHVLVAAYRNIEVAVRDRMREIMTRMGLERLVVFSAAEEAAEAKAAADRTKAAGRAEKAQQAAQAAAKKAAERKAQKAEAVAKALAAKTAKVEAAAKALAAKTAKAEAEAKRRAEAKPKAKKESVPAPPAARGKRGNQETGPGKFTSKTGTVEVVRYITDGPARGWMVKGRAYTSSTQYFVKRPEAQLWETRYQALKGYNQTDPICTAVEKLRVEISEELAQPAKASASSSVSEDTPRRSEDSGSRKRLRLVSNSRPAPPESEEPKASAPAPPASAPAEPEEPEPKRRVLRLKVSSSSEEGRASPPKVSPPRREPPQQEPPKPPSKAQAKKEESPRPSQASPKSSPKAKAKAASAKAKPSQAASPKGSIPVRKELKRRASSSVETIRTLD